MVNALSKRVEVTVRRDGQVYSIAFENGEKVEDLHRHWYLWQTQYRDQRPFLAGRKLLRQPAFLRFAFDPSVKAKAVLCPGVEIVFRDQVERQRAALVLCRWP